MLRWHLNGSPADPRRIRPRFPERLSRFLRRLTRRDRSERIANAEEALALLGAAKQIEERFPPAITDRAERAKLRLALDAARLGARRLFTLPCRRPESEALLREVLVWSQIHGLCFFRLRSGDDLLRLVLRLLVARGRSARRLTLKYSLHRWLPLGVLCGFPVRDLTRSNGREFPGSAGAKQISRFILDCSAAKALVLRIEEQPCDRLLAAVGNVLRHALEPSRPPRPDAGGLLLLLDQSCHSAR